MRVNIDTEFQCITCGAYYTKAVLLTQSSWGYCHCSTPTCYEQFRFYDWKGEVRIVEEHTGVVEKESKKVLTRVREDYGKIIPFSPRKEIIFAVWR